MQPRRGEVWWGEEPERKRRPYLAGATAQVNLGVVVSSPLLDEEPETWVTGDPLGWCQTVIDPTAGKITVGGERRLAGALLESLHERLFTPAQ